MDTRIYDMITDLKVAPNGLPLIRQSHNTKVDILTAVNYEKWYNLFLIKMDGSVETVNPGVIDAAMDKHPKARYIDHEYHPKLLQEVAKLLGAEVDIVTLEVAAGRWVLNHSDIEGMEYYDDEYYNN